MAGLLAAASLPPRSEGDRPLQGLAGFSQERAAIVCLAAVDPLDMPEECGPGV